MLCGGAEVPSPYIWAGFDAMRVLCRKFNDEPERASRPMSASARRLHPGLRAPACWCSRASTARARAARASAPRCSAWRSNCGGHRGGGSMTAPNPDGVRRCIRGGARRRGARARRGRRDQRAPDRHRRRPARGRRLGARARARPGRLPADHLDQVADRPRARRGGRDRVAWPRADARGRLRARLAQLRGRAPRDRALRGLDPARDARAAGALA